MKHKTGLTLGKFAPLHRGHQLVIDTMRREMDRAIVVVYDAPETTHVPLAVRADWVRMLYPDVKVIEAWDGPTEVGYTSEIMRAHEDYLINTLGIRGITHFYSSESYGDHVSHALGATDRRVDQARQEVPISATDIRADPYIYRAYLHPLVYRSLITNVVLLGAPCTGKSTLACALAREFRTEWMPEYGREYWEAHQVDRRLSPEQLVEIAEGHLEREEQHLQRANRFLFTDTNAITTLTFARYYHGAPDPQLSALADLAVLRYDLTFVCAADFPYVDTWDRSGAANREAFQRQVIADLQQRKVPFIHLRGTIEERIARVTDILARFHKYMNPLDLFQGAAR